MGFIHCLSGLRVFAVAAIMVALTGDFPGLSSRTATRLQAQVPVVRPLPKHEARLSLQRLTAAQRETLRNGAQQIGRVNVQLAQLPDLRQPERAVLDTVQRGILGPQRAVAEIIPMLPDELEPVKANLSRLDRMLLASAERFQQVQPEQAVENALIVEYARHNLTETAAVWNHYGRAQTAGVELICVADVRGVDFRYSIRYCYDFPRQCAEPIWYDWGLGTIVAEGDYVIRASKSGYKSKYQWRRCIYDPTTAQFVMETDD